MDLVLSSGWLAFAAHSGFLAAVDDAGVEVNGVCGTSSGALTGALWAAGLPARDVLALVGRRSPLSWVTPHAAVWRGVFRLDGMIAELHRYLPPAFTGLSRPFGVGVVGLDGVHRVLTEGSLPEAVAASCAVPRLFMPVDVDGVRYVDGGAAERIGLSAWRAHRPATRPLVHRVAPSLGLEEPLSGVLRGVVHSPRSGARLWSLGDVDARFDRAYRATVRAVG